MPLLTSPLRAASLPRPSTLSSRPLRLRLQTLRLQYSQSAGGAQGTGGKAVSSVENGSQSVLASSSSSGAVAASASSSTASSAASSAASPAASPAATKSIWLRLGPLSRAVQAYGRSQRKRPYLTQTVSAIAIFALGDVSAQQIGSKDYDPVRTARSMLIGGIFAIPQFKWFLFLSHNFNYASRALSLATKVVVNQMVFTPGFSTYFFGMQALLSGESLAATAQRLRDTVPRAFVNALKLWPAVTVVNFSVVPLEYRSIVAGIVAVGWQTYLSYLNRLAEMKEEEGAAAAASETAAAAVVA